MAGTLKKAQTGSLQRMQQLKKVKPDGAKKIGWWKLNEEEYREEFAQEVEAKVRGQGSFPKRKSTFPDYSDFSLTDSQKHLLFP